MKLRSAYPGPVNVTVGDYNTTVDFVLEVGGSVAVIDDKSVAEKLLLVSQQVEEAGGSQVYWLDADQGGQPALESESPQPTTTQDDPLVKTGPGQSRKRFSRRSAEPTPIKPV